MPENEIIYRTNLDFHKTIKRLEQCRDLKTRYNPECGPRGICYIWYKSVACKFGARGGIQIHYDSEEDHSRFVEIVRIRGHYLPGASREWVKMKERFGRSHYMKWAERLQHWVDYEDPWSPIAYINRALLEGLRSYNLENYFKALWCNIFESFLSLAAVSDFKDVVRQVQGSLRR